ncbi:hypothetical protein EON67_10265 [archaeon]|nr:MAG: hypothetical protein EON67_10265 [archaeon]
MDVFSRVLADSSMQLSTQLVTVRMLSHLVHAIINPTLAAEPRQVRVLLDELLTCHVMKLVALSKRMDAFIAMVCSRTGTCTRISRCARSPAGVRLTNRAPLQRLVHSAGTPSAR